MTTLSRVTDDYVGRFGTSATRIKVREGATDDRGEVTEDTTDTESITVVPDARSPSSSRSLAGPRIEGDLVVYIKSSQTIHDADDAPDGWADRIKIYGETYTVLSVRDTMVHLEKRGDE